MQQDERAAMVAEIAHYRELLSGTLDPAELQTLETIIARLEGKLAAFDRASPPGASSAPTIPPPLNR
jgi:hypothetical protein